VFQKGSIVNNSKLGKFFLNLRDLPYGSTPMPITFRPSNYGEKKDRVNGLAFLTAEYAPRPAEVFYSAWQQSVFNIHPIHEGIGLDRYEHFNDYLSNSF